MKLNPDCVRDTLIAIESQPIGSALQLPDLCNLLPKYSEAEVFYTCKKLEEGRFINAKVKQSIGVLVVDDLTYNGHEFLAKIRDEKHWGAVKKGLSAVRDFSLSAISSLAEGIASAVINSYLSKTEGP